MDFPRIVWKSPSLETTKNVKSCGQMKPFIIKSCVQMKPSIFLLCNNQGSTQNFFTRGIFSPPPLPPAVYGPGNNKMLIKITGI